MEGKMHEMNMDAPAIMRRRRRIARQQREKTPEPIAKTGGVRPKYSDEESSSTTDFNNRSAARNERRVKSKTASTSSGGGSGGGGGNGSSATSNIAYRNKILNRRDRATGPMSGVVRSQSTPRSMEPEHKNEGQQTDERSSGSSNVMSFLRQAKRSLSIPG